MLPRVFISSTIRDFEDLRSAHHYWISRQGFNVQASEFSNFDVRPTADTFDACFNSIRESDIYVVLIGNRRGSWYDETARISVTQQEYRVAYRNFLQFGRPLVVRLARRGTWEKAEELRGSLATLAGDVTSIDLLIKAAPFEDARHLLGFLAEVQSLSPDWTSDCPASEASGLNWVHRFYSFEESLSVLNRVLGLNVDLASKGMLTAAANELVDLLKAHTYKFSSTHKYFSFILIRSLRDKYPIDKITRDRNEDIKMLGADLQQLGIYLLGVGAKYHRSYAALERVCFSPAFMEYNPAKKTMVPTRLQLALQRVHRIAREVLDCEHYAPIIESRKILLDAGYQIANDAYRAVRVFDLLMIFSEANKVERFILEALNIIGHVLYGQPLIEDPAVSVPLSPIVGLDKPMKEETPSREDVLDLVRKEFNL